MKKTIGYGFKLPRESIEQAVATYGRVGEFSKNRKEALEDIKRGKETGSLSKTCRPKIFKVIVEVE